MSKSVKELLDEKRIQKVKDRKEREDQERQHRIQEAHDKARKGIDDLISSFEHRAFKLSSTNEEAASFISSENHLIISKGLSYIALNEHSIFSDEYIYINNDQIYLEWKTLLENKFDFKLSFEEVNEYVDGSDGNYNINLIGVAAIFQFN